MFSDNGNMAAELKRSIREDVFDVCVKKRTLTYGTFSTNPVDVEIKIIVYSFTGLHCGSRYSVLNIVYDSRKDVIYPNECVLYPDMINIDGNAVVFTFITGDNNMFAKTVKPGWNFIHARKLHSNEILMEMHV